MTTVIILLAGMGRRMNIGKNKLLLEVDSHPLFYYTLEKFREFTNNIILVVSETDYDYFNSLNLGYLLVKGGSTRCESVLNGLRHVKTDRVLIHDGARCLVSKRIIKECLESDADAYFVGVPLKNTVRYDSSFNFKDLDRKHLIDVQTPQGGLTKLFLESANVSKEVTDDISMLEDRSKVKLILGDDYNIKITTPFDLKIFKLLKEENYD